MWLEGRVLVILLLEQAVGLIPQEERRAGVIPLERPVRHSCFG